MYIIVRIKVRYNQSLSRIMSGITQLSCNSCLTYIPVFSRSEPGHKHNSCHTTQPPPSCTQVHILAWHDTANGSTAPKRMPPLLHRLHALSYYTGIRMSCIITILYLIILSTFKYVTISQSSYVEYYSTLGQHLSSQDLSQGTDI